MLGLDPLVIIVMGVSASGKSTLGKALAQLRGIPFVEGDSFHSAGSLKKMAAGVALGDADRRPWLEAIAADVAGRRKQTSVVAACSALKRQYRERLVAGIGEPVLFVLLQLERDRLLSRLQARDDHFMPAALLDSQLETLEIPGAGESSLLVPGTIDAPHLSELIAEESCRSWSHMGVLAAT